MWVVHIELNPSSQAYFRTLPAHWVPTAYRSRLARKTHPQAITQSMAGLWLLEQALWLAGHTHVALDDIDIDAHGRPLLAAGPAFSIAHSDQHAVCAIADPVTDATRIGIDIEQPRVMAPARAARLLCSEEERTAVALQPTRFFDYWCAREATVKASGRVGLKRMRQTQLCDRTAWLDHRCWTLHPLNLAPKLKACLASDAAATVVIQIKQLAVPRG